MENRMKTRIFRTAVIGLGRIAWSDHLPELLRRPEQFQVCAVVDPLTERGEEARVKFGVEHHYASLEEMLAHETPDLAVVCSPTAFHAAQTIQLLEHGVNVFCDKPVAASLAETRAMFAAAEKNQRKLMVFQPRRMYDNSFAIKQIIQSGKLGEIYQLKLYIGNYVRRNDWQAFRKNCGGMLRNYGAHYVDQMMYLLGEPLEPLCCQTARIASLGDADDVVKIVLRGRRSGILADIDINQASGFLPFVWAVYGKNGAAYLMRHGASWTIHYFDPAELAPEETFDRMAAENRQYPHDTIPFRSEEFLPEVPGGYTSMFYENLHGWLSGTAEPFVPASDTLTLMETLEQCRIMAEGK